MCLLSCKYALEKTQFEIEKSQTDTSILSMCLDYIGFVYRNMLYYVLVSVLRKAKRNINKKIEQFYYYIEIIITNRFLIRISYNFGYTYEAP